MEYTPKHGAAHQFVANDFGLNLTDSNADGYFSSNRSGAFGGDDLYYLRVLSLQTAIAAPIITFTRSELQQKPRY